MRLAVALAFGVAVWACATGHSGETAAAVEMVGPGVISTAAPEFATSLTPDGATIFFNRASADRSHIEILFSQRTGSGWNEPKPVSFTGRYRDLDPFVTPDGSRLYFSSNRPSGGSGEQSIDIWYVEKTREGWGEPVHPGSPLNSEKTDVFVSVARDGTTLFSSDRDGTMKVYQSRLSGNTWAPPTPVRFGSVEAAGNPMISPDGRFVVIVNPGPVGGSDLYVSCRQGAQWGSPKLLPPPINSAFADFAPGLHDGFLYFTSERPGIVGPQPAGSRPPGDLYRVALEKVTAICPR